VAAIQIRPGNNGRLIVTFLYTPERVDKIKTIQGKWWHPEEKHWKDRYTVIGEPALETLREYWCVCRLRDSVDPNFMVLGAQARRYDECNHAVAPVHEQ
jgi:hypothetical protein